MSKRHYHFAFSCVFMSKKYTIHSLAIFKKENWYIFQPIYKTKRALSRVWLQSCVNSYTTASTACILAGIALYGRQHYLAIGQYLTMTTYSEIYSVTLGP